MFTVYVHTKCNVQNSNSLLVAAIKLKGTYITHYSRHISIW